MNPNKVSFTLNQVDAIKFIIDQHGAQRRVGSVLPYVVHPIEVASFAGRFYPQNQDLIMAAYLHDVLEDTNAPEHLIEHKVGKTVLSLIKGVTAKDEDFPSWRARRQHQIDKLKDAPLDVVRLKACDMLSNAQSIVFDKTYRPNEGYPKFKSDPDAVVWYYTRSVVMMGERLGTHEPVVVALNEAIFEMS